jgi:hypothetical protein
MWDYMIVQDTLWSALVLAAVFLPGEIVRRLRKLRKEDNPLRNQPPFST